MPHTTAQGSTVTPRVLVFDSGIGGLSIVEAIKHHHPQCHLFYASDNAAFPYGTQAEETLVNRVDTVLHQLQQITQAHIIVVACNTASTVVLPRIRERFDEPIIGVVPAIKPAAKHSNTRHIGLLATPGTIDRAYTQELIDEFAKHCQCTRIGSSELVHLAEQKLRGNNIDITQLNAIIEPFTREPNIDTIVLACTHFPFLLPELKVALPHIKHWVDSAQAIARRVGHWLTELDLPKHPPACTNGDAYFTQKDDTITQLTPYLSKMGLHTQHFI